MGTSCFYFEGLSGTYKVKPPSVESAIFSPVTGTTDQFKCLDTSPPHTGVKCNVSPEIHSYSKHEANALARKTQWDRRRDEGLIKQDRDQ